jgi:hypothetical protein
VLLTFSKRYAINRQHDWLGFDDAPCCWGLLISTWYNVIVQQPSKCNDTFRAVYSLTIKYRTLRHLQLYTYKEHRTCSNICHFLGLNKNIN